MSMPKMMDGGKGHGVIQAVIKYMTSKSFY